MRERAVVSIELKHLRYVEAAECHGSFRKAAECLSVKQSNLGPPHSGARRTAWRSAVRINQWRRPSDVLKRPYEAIENGVINASDPSLKERIAELSAIRDQAHAVAQRVAGAMMPGCLEPDRPCLGQRQRRCATVPRAIDVEQLRASQGPMLRVLEVAQRRPHIGPCGSALRYRRPTWAFPP